MFNNRTIWTKCPGGQRSGLIWVNDTSGSPPDLSEWSDIFKPVSAQMPFEGDGVLKNETYEYQHTNYKVYRRIYHFHAGRNLISRKDPALSTDYYVSPSRTLFGGYIGPALADGSTLYQGCIWIEYDIGKVVFQGNSGYDTEQNREALFTDIMQHIGAVSTHPGTVSCAVEAGSYIQAYNMDLTQLNPVSVPQQTHLYTGTFTAADYGYGDTLSASGSYDTIPSALLRFATIGDTDAPMPYLPMLFTPQFIGTASLTPPSAQAEVQSWLLNSGQITGGVAPWGYQPAAAAKQTTVSVLGNTPMYVGGGSHLIPTIDKNKARFNTQVKLYRRYSNDWITAIAGNCAISYLTA